MATCKWCNRSGWFLTTDERELCANCSAIVGVEINQRARIIINSLAVVKESKDLETRLSRYDLALQHLAPLIRYEQRGVATLTTKPSILIQQITALREKMICEMILADFNSIQERIALGESVRSSVNKLSKLLFQTHELRSAAKKQEALANIETAIKHKIDEIQLSAFLDDAKKAEFKGQKKKAADKYYEALYLLRNDDVDDALQTESLSFIEGKIRELGGEVK